MCLLRLMRYLNHFYIAFNNVDEKVHVDRATDCHDCADINNL
jgi:hypothetical protein